MSFRETWSAKAGEFEESWNCAEIDCMRTISLKLLCEPADEKTAGGLLLMKVS